MTKIKEVISAFTAGDFPGAVRINRKEHEPMSDERFRLILNRIVLVVAIIAGVDLIPQLEAGVALFLGLVGLILILFKWAS